MLSISIDTTTGRLRYHNEDITSEIITVSDSFLIVPQLDITDEIYYSVYVSGIEPDIRKPYVDVSLIPSELILESNYPNPCNPSTTINFGLSGTQHVEISVYSLTGQKIITLVNGIMQGGYHQVKWDGRDSSVKQVTSGIYIYKINSVGKRLAMKMAPTK